MNNDTKQTQLSSSDGANSGAAVRPLQLLRAGSFQFGIFADEIAAITAWQQPTPLPLAPRSVLGVVSVQGRMLTVLDLAALPGRESAENNKATQHLIALRGDEQLALAVDALGEAIEVSADELPSKDETKESLVLGVVNRNGSEICILDPKELFSTAIQGRERRRRRF